MQNKVELKQVADYIGDTEFMTITVYNFLDELSTSKIVKTLPKDTLHPIIILVDEVRIIFYSFKFLSNDLPHILDNR